MHFHDVVHPFSRTSCSVPLQLIGSVTTGHCDGGTNFNFSSGRSSCDRDAGGKGAGARTCPSSVGRGWKTTGVDDADFRARTMSAIIARNSAICRRSASMRGSFASMDGEDVAFLGATSVFWEGSLSRSKSASPGLPCAAERWGATSAKTTSNTIGMRIEWIHQKPRKRGPNAAESAESAFAKKRELP